MSWSEPILHVDMDAFFVEVERLRRPDLVGKAVVVGGDGPRGVVAAASYEARASGVASAMPMSRARRQCRDLVVVPPDHSAYRAMSEQVFAMFQEVTPLVEGLSLDEAFLDVAGLWRHHPSPVSVGVDIRSRIRAELELPASVGVASNKFLAKLASEAAKPDGLFHVPVATQLDFLHALPVRALWGVGEATRAALAALGVETVGDVSGIPSKVLERRLGVAHGRHLAALATGVDARPVVSESAAKSLSVEQTYSTDLRGVAVIDAELLAHTDSLASRLRRAGLAARTISVKIRYSDFTTMTRSSTGPAPIDNARDLHRIARRLAAEIDLDRPIRLLGVTGGGLQPADGPRQLVAGDDDEWDRIADAVESVRKRFGDHSIEHASMLDRGRHPS
ncbi:DNA polymerase IV [soil metagenome]